MATLQILVLGEVYSAASYDRCYLEYFRGTAGPSHYRQQWEMQRAHTQRVAEKSVFLSYIGTFKFSSPDKESRTLLTDRANELAPKMAASAIVIPQTGFGPATIRAIIAGMNMVVRQPVPSEVFADLPRAYDWLSQYVPLEVATLGSYMQELIRQVEAQS